MSRVAFDASTREAQAVAVSQRIRESLLLGRSASEPLQIVPFHQWFQSLRVYDFNSLVAAKEILGSLITLLIAFFFTFGTKITSRSNVAITGLTLPTVTKFCPR